MAVRNSRPRQSKDYVFADYNGQRFMLVTGSFQTMAIVYYTRKKLLQGKLNIPIVENPKNLTTMLITCSIDENLKFDWI